MSTILLGAPAPFQAWLESKPPEATVGLARWANTCPLHEFLVVINELAPRKVCVGRLIYYIEGKQHDLPAWARRFIRSIDHQFCEYQEVSAAQALTTLKEVDISAKGE